MRYADRRLAFDAALRDLKHPNPRVRVRAADALGAVETESGETARVALRAALADDDGEVRYTVALALGELRDRAALPALVAQMEGDGNPMPRQAAAIALGQIGDASAVPALERALRGGPPDVRFQATASLAQLDAAAARGPLVAALRDEDGEVRGAAATAIGDLGDRSLARALVPLLVDLHPGAQLEAAASLARLGDARGAQVLVRALADRDQDRVLLAAEHLCRCPDPGVAPTLRRFLARWLTPGLVKVWLAGALAALGDEAGRARLLGFLHSRRQMVRGLAIKVLGELGAGWACAALRALSASGTARGWEEEIEAALTSRQEPPA